MKNIHLTIDNLVIVRDFNVHLETTCSHSKTFQSLIESFYIIEKVKFSIHIHGHTLDLVLLKSNNDNISYVHTTDAFSVQLNLTTPKSLTDATVTFLNTIELTKKK